MGKVLNLGRWERRSRRNKANIITEEEKEIMWAKGILGDSDPTSLNYTIFYAICQQFGNREHQEHHQIHIEDQKIVKRLELVDQNTWSGLKG